MIENGHRYLAVFIFGLYLQHSLLQEKEMLTCATLYFHKGIGKSINPHLRWDQCVWKSSERCLVVGIPIQWLQIFHCPKEVWFGGYRCQHDSVYGDWPTSTCMGTPYWTDHVQNLTTLAWLGKYQPHFHSLGSMWHFFSLFKTVGFQISYGLKLNSRDPNPAAAPPSQLTISLWS